MPEENKKFSLKNLFKFKLNLSKKTAYILCGVLFAIMIVIFSSTFFSNKTAKQATGTPTVSEGSYEEFVEGRLSTILNSVKGLNNVKVYVSVDATPQIVYLSESSSNASGILGESIVLSKNGTQSSPVIALKTYPEIKGVLVVARGVTARSKLELANTLSLVLNVNLSSIEILEGK